MAVGRRRQLGLMLIVLRHIGTMSPTHLLKSAVGWLIDLGGLVVVANDVIATIAPLWRDVAGEIIKAMG